jgi:hypothetical protein
MLMLMVVPRNTATHTHVLVWMHHARHFGVRYSRCDRLYFVAKLDEGLWDHNRRPGVVVGGVDGWERWQMRCRVGAKYRSR